MRTRIVSTLALIAIAVGVAGPVYASTTEKSPATAGRIMIVIKPPPPVR